MSRKIWKIAGINFDHMHMGDNLRMAANAPNAEIVALCDPEPERTRDAARNFGIPENRIYDDLDRCIDETRPDLAILCPATAEHAEWTERVARRGVHVLIEKPFAATLADADRMIAAAEAAGVLLAVNWPLAWVPAHVHAKRLVDRGDIGKIVEVHYYGGNRGPLYHRADKIEVDPETVAREKPHSWFYKKSRGGGSLLDYLGYGATLGTWYRDGEIPVEVAALTDEPEGLEVDEHGVAVVRYTKGLSVLQTRWGTLTDPWVHQTRPKCGFVLVGEHGTIASYDYEPEIEIQTRKHPQGIRIPAPPLPENADNPVNYVLHKLESNQPLEGPLSPTVSRIGQRIVDTAHQAAQQKRTLPLLP